MSLVAISPPPRSSTADQLAPDLWRVTAGNSSPLTGPGTNSYILGDEALFVIDPGPDDGEHLSRLLNVIAGRSVTAILLTHSHRDHSDLAPRLAGHCDAPIWAFGRATDGRSAFMQRIAPMDSVSSGTDYGLIPDRNLQHGERLPFGDCAVTTLHTPGHLANHICYLWRDMIFTGDHVLGWTSTVVIPPDGDMTQYMTSLDTLEALTIAQPFIGLPGHGAHIQDLRQRVNELRHHRLQRAARIRMALSLSPKPLSAITRAAYPDITPDLLPFAAKSCLAQLLVWLENGTSRSPAPFADDPLFSLTPDSGTGK